MIKIISCNIFENMLQKILKEKSFQFEVKYIGMENHVVPSKLKELIVKEIRETEADKKYSKIILLYGLCGNAIEGIDSSLPIIVPKAHDCCAIFLESGKKFYENFSERLSAEWYTTDYLEKIEELKKVDENFKMNYSRNSLDFYIEKYGDDNGRYLFDILSNNKKEIIFIETMSENDEKNINYLKKQYECVEIVKGGKAFIEKLLEEKKVDDEVLYLKAGEKITPTYDENVIEGIKINK
ncbi:MAG: DUF1638 domain-containing protein [Fusobacteriaceae bacterium]